MTDMPGDEQLPDQVEAGDSLPEAPPAEPEKAAAPTADERLAALHAQIAKIEASRPVPPGFTRLKVAPPHDGFMYGGFWVNSTPTLVNQLLVPGLTQAANEAGVTLIEEGA